MGLLAGFVCMVFVIAFAVIWDAHAKRKKEQTLSGLAESLGGTVTSSNSIGTRRHEVQVVYTFADRGVGSSHEPWTEVSAVLPPQYPLTIRVVRGTPQHGQPVVDIELGTPPFDDYFIVEAAPADVVRQLIDEPARMFLTNHIGRVELETVDGGLRLSTTGWIEDASHARGLCDYVALLASRVRDAYAAANEAAEPERGGSPYRPLPGAHVEDLQAAREREVGYVQQVQKERHEQQRMQVFAVWGVIGGFAMLVFALSVC